MATPAPANRPRPTGAPSWAIRGWVAGGTLVVVGAAILLSSGPGVPMTAGAAITFLGAAVGLIVLIAYLLLPPQPAPSPGVAPRQIGRAHV